MRIAICTALAALAFSNSGCTPTGSSQTNMDRELLEITIPALQEGYRSHRYTVTEVVRWHLARIRKYNGIYRAIQTVDDAGALAAAAREDAEAQAGGDGFVRGALWGVPLV